VVWIPPFISLAISLACLVLAFRRIFHLDGTRRALSSSRLMTVLLPLVAEFAHTPVLNALDCAIRINW